MCSSATSLFIQTCTPSNSSVLHPAISMIHMEKSHQRYALAFTFFAAVVCASTWKGFDFLRKQMRPPKTVRFADEHGHALIEVCLVFFFCAVASHLDMCLEILFYGYFTTSPATAKRMCACFVTGKILCKRFACALPELDNKNVAFQASLSALCTVHCI